MQLVTSNFEESGSIAQKRSATLLTFLMLISSIVSMQLAAFEASATVNDQDADGLPYGIEFLINTQPQDWDSDNDGLPDGWDMAPWRFYKYIRVW